MKKIYLAFAVLVFTGVTTNVCRAQNPQLMGMTYGGGAHSCGTIFKMNSDGTGFQTVYSFDTLTGMNPYGTLLQGTDGKFYGMTNYGGNAHYGVIFSFDPVNNTYNMLHSFNDTDGTSPFGSLIQLDDGNLYGMTYRGGSHEDGVIFKYSPSGNIYTKLFDFVDSLGAFPKGGLMQASDGKLYGMTSTGGNNFGNGTLFSFDPANKSFSKKVDFTTVEGNAPFCDLTEMNGMLYGTTRYGGTNSAGVIFHYDIAGNHFSKLLDFAGGNQQLPSAGLKSAGDGKLYGMTLQGGANNLGCVYSFDTAGNIYKVVQDFDSLNGSSPQYNTLMHGSDAKLYGMTVNGGDYNNGVIFSYDPADSTFTKLHDFNGTNGKNPYGTLMELQITTQVQDQEGKIHITIYPNPANAQLFLYSSIVRAEDEASVNITNVLGQEVLSQGIIKSKEERTIIYIGNLTPGLYFLQIKAALGIVVTRFMKE